MSTTRTGDNNNNEEKKKEEELSPEEKAKQEEEKKKRAEEDELRKKASSDMLAYASPYLARDVPAYTYQSNDGKQDNSIAIESGNAELKTTPGSVKPGAYSPPPGSGRETIYVDDKGVISMRVPHHLVDKDPGKYYRQKLEFALKHAGKDSPRLDFPNGMNLDHIRAALKEAKSLNMNLQFGPKMMAELEHMRLTDRVPFEPNVHDGRGQKLFDEIEKLRQDMEWNYHEKSQDTKLLVNYGRTARELNDDQKPALDRAAETDRLAKNDEGQPLDHAGQVKKINGEVEKLDARMGRLEKAQNDLLGESGANRNVKLAEPLHAARVELRDAMSREHTDINARREFLNERLQHLEANRPAPDVSGSPPAPSAPPKIDVSDVRSKYDKADFTNRLQNVNDKVANVASAIQNKAEDLDRVAALRQPK